MGASGQAWLALYPEDGRVKIFGRCSSSMRELLLVVEGIPCEAANPGEVFRPDEGDEPEAASTGADEEAQQERRQERRVVIKTTQAEEEGELSVAEGEVVTVWIE